MHCTDVLGTWLGVEDEKMNELSGAGEGNNDNHLKSPLIGE